MLYWLVETPHDYLGGVEPTDQDPPTSDQTPSPIRQPRPRSPFGCDWKTVIGLRLYLEGNMAEPPFGSDGKTVIGILGRDDSDWMTERL